MVAAKTTLFVLVFLFFHKGHWTTNDFYAHKPDTEMGIVYRDEGECNMFGAIGLSMTVLDPKTPKDVADTLTFKCVPMDVIKDHNYGTD